MTTVYLVIAGNIIDDYSPKDTGNLIEVFDNEQTAESFGLLYDYHTVTPKEILTSDFGVIDYHIKQ